MSCIFFPLNINLSVEVYIVIIEYYANYLRVKDNIISEDLCFQSPDVELSLAVE